VLPVAPVIRMFALMIISFPNDKRGHKQSFIT
jgi:hypothetical protein